MRLSISALFGGKQRREAAAPAAEQPAAPRSTPRTGASNLLVLPASSAMSISTVYCCVNVIANTVASLPLRYLKRGRDGVYLTEDGMMNYLLGLQPNADYNAFDFISTAVRQVLLRGKALIVPVWDTVSIGEPLSLVLCSADSWSYDKNARKYLVNDAENGITDSFDENEVIHLKNLSIDGKEGLSVLTYARLTTDIAGVGDSETLNRFANGGNIRGIVSNDTSVRGFGEYADNELKKTAESLDERFRGGERIVNLPGQAQFHQLSMTSVDMEFLGSRKFTVREICRFFGVHPSFVFDDTSNNYKSAEMANIAFLGQTINPLLVKFEQEFQRKLVAPHRYGKYKFEFDRRGLYTADLQSKAAYQKQTIESGVYSINDWRSFENQPAVAGGDSILVSANLKSLGELLTPTINNQQNNGEE